MKNIKVVTIIMIMFFCCSSCQTPIDRTLRLAGNNHSELQKVLDYFEKDSCADRLVAAKFIIEHMPGNFACDTGHLSKYRPFLSQARAILNNGDQQMQKDRLESSWLNFQNQYGAPTEAYGVEPDCQYLKADYLINDIVDAYHAWKDNPFNQNVQFQDFLEYVLPYRRKNGLPVELWRSHFNQMFQNHFHKYKRYSLLKACDTLLYDFRNIKHSQFVMTNFPLMKVEDFENIQQGLCEHKCWYNSMLFASLGIACAIDFVPAWGNRNASHSWNVIIDRDTSYAFEPFWDTDRWKYKRLYNNTSWDARWGKFRLPKVFRHTYSSHPDGPLLDSKVDPHDIPALFRNYKKKDVSNEYFETSNVKVDLTGSIPKETYYCYLCVFGYQQWHPVQWVRIEGNKVVFSNMGRDIVYLPCYYKAGKLIYAASPFLLKTDGTIQMLKGQEITNKPLVVNRILPKSGEFQSFVDRLARGNFFVEDENGGMNTSMVLELPDSLQMGKNIFHFSDGIIGNSARFVFPQMVASVAEIEFYTKGANGVLEKIHGVVEASEALNSDDVLKAFDGYTATSFNSLEIPSHSRGGSSPLWLGLSFDEKVRIDAFAICPELIGNLHEGEMFELFIWRNGWQSLDAKCGQNREAVFSNVVEDGLYLLKNKSWNERSAERIFIYEDGEQKWY